MRTFVHVNAHEVQSNEKTGAREPVISIRRGGVFYLANVVEVLGPSRVVYSPDAPLEPGGIRVWVETEGDVVLDGKLLEQDRATPGP